MHSYYNKQQPRKITQEEEIDEKLEEVQEEIPEDLDYEASGQIETSHQKQHKVSSFDVVESSNQFDKNMIFEVPFKDKIQHQIEELKAEEELTAGKIDRNAEHEEEEEEEWNERDDFDEDDDEDGDVQLDHLKKKGNVQD